MHPESTEGEETRVDATTVLLTIPGRPEYLRLARLAAADVGARAGLTFEDIEDLRIAVDELCFAVLDGLEQDGSPLHLRYGLQPEAVEVEGWCDAEPGAGAIRPTELARAIVAAVVDEHELTSAQGTRRFRLRKQLGGST